MSLRFMKDLHQYLFPQLKETRRTFAFTKKKKVKTAFVVGFAAAFTEAGHPEQREWPHRALYPGTTLGSVSASSSEHLGFIFTYFVHC